jgi:hypothetical protein
MRNSIDFKTVILVILTVSAVALTLIRERSVAPTLPTGPAVTEEGPPLVQISPIVDSTLQQMGVNTQKIRRLKISVGESKGVRQEVRVSAPPKFEVLRAITSLTDSLKRFNVTLVSTENLRAKSSSIHLLYAKRVFESIVITRERPQKGADLSERKIKKGIRRKAPR